MTTKKKPKVYLDTDVFISCVREEINGALNMRFLEAEEFFLLCEKLGATLVLSKLFFNEVRKITGLDRQDVFDILNGFGFKTEVFERTLKESELEVFKKSGMHHSDATHASSAIISGAMYLVTWNKPHFEVASNFIKALAPNEFTGLFQHTSKPAHPSSPV